MSKPRGQHAARGAAVYHCVFLLCALILTNSTPGKTQQAVEQSELIRLEQNTEEAIANGDPDGAAINIGKAALMASQLARESSDRNLIQLYKGAESLFRGQENAFRALAMFERAGNQPPASSPVCAALELASRDIQHSVEHLAQFDQKSATAFHTQQQARYSASAQEWSQTFVDFYDAFECS